MAKFSTICALKDKYKNQTIYIVGTGPSMQVFPIEFLKDKITIGLNQAYKYCTLTYSLTIHPYLIPLDSSKWNTKWLTKHKFTDKTYKKHLKLGNYKKFYIFQNNNNAVKNFQFFKPSFSEKGKLYVGRGIQTGAINLAGLMGAKTAILVGCDMCDILDTHHGHNQHTEFHEYSAKEVYDEYYYYTAKIRKLALEYYNLTILTLTPFLGLKHVEKDYTYLLKEKNLSPHIKAKDIEVYERSGDIVSDFL